MFSTIRAYRKFDPAAKSSMEILFLYPGVRALFFYRFANWLYRHHFFFFARFVSETARILTGIEIHPGATIGKDVILEHGMGTVIGETSIIGNGVIILHGVTLGSRRVLEDKGARRHPTIEDGVILCAGAKVLGPVTVGKGARIGANAVVLFDIPADMTAVGVKAEVKLSSRSQPKLAA